MNNTDGGFDELKRHLLQASDDIEKERSDSLARNTRIIESEGRKYFPYIQTQFDRYKEVDDFEVKLMLIPDEINDEVLNYLKQFKGEHLLDEILPEELLYQITTVASIMCYRIEERGYIEGYRMFVGLRKNATGDEVDDVRKVVPLNSPQCFNTRNNDPLAASFRSLVTMAKGRMLGILRDAHPHAYFRVQISYFEGDESPASKDFRQTGMLLLDSVFDGMLDPEFVVEVRDRYIVWKTEDPHKYFSLKKTGLES